MRVAAKRLQQGHPCVHQGGLVLVENGRRKKELSPTLDIRAEAEYKDRHVEVPSESGLELREVVVEPVERAQEGRFRRLLDAHHYLGALPKIGETLWYVGRWRGEWVALMVFSAPALKCGVRDRWIGWDFRTQYDRLHLVTNNTRFLILPGWHRPNLASRLLGLCERRLAADWPARFGHAAVLLETFVDPARFAGTIYRAANWRRLGRTRGYRRVRGGYSEAADAPKLVFVRPLVSDARARLTRPALLPADRHGGSKLMLSADDMRALPAFFYDIDDPRRAQGRRHSLPTVLALATAATLCGARGYKAMAEWVRDLSPRARERFRCRYRHRRHEVPSEFVIRDVLVRVDPAQLDRALQRWHAEHGPHDEALALDGKTLRNAVYTDPGATTGEAPCQTHLLGAVGHTSRATHAQKKSTGSPSAPTTKPNAPTKSAPSSPCSTAGTPISPAPPSPPTPCSPSASSRTASANAAPTTCSPSRPTSPPCSTTSKPSSENAANPTSANRPASRTGASKAAPSGAPNASTTT